MFGVLCKYTKVDKEKSVNRNLYKKNISNKYRNNVFYTLTTLYNFKKEIYSRILLVQLYWCN